MKRPATFTILAVVILAAALIGCAGSSRQAENAAMTEEQTSDQQAERAAMTRGRTPESSVRERYAAAERELRAAVAAGRITEDQAKERLEAMRERIAMTRGRTPERNVREQYAAAEQEIRAAVAAGRITEEQARKRLVAMRERMAAASRGGGERERAPLTREQYAAAEREIRAAVEAGRITLEQARERLVAMRERMALAAERAGGRERMPSGREIALFNNRDLSGWEYYLTDENASMEDVWSIEDGILVCQGEPRGYLSTDTDYENFRLVVEWRWPGEPGNSGVLLRITGEPQMLPNCAEAQLRSGSAGDMYGFNGFTIGGDEERLSEISIGWSLPGLERNEKEPGEWNCYEITVIGGTITVMLNGKLVNEATGCDVRPGRVGLQSEGGVIHFRTVTLTTLEGR